MVFRIAGGIGLVLLGISLVGVAGVSIPPIITAIALIVGGIGLLAGY